MPSLCDVVVFCWAMTTAAAFVSPQRQRPRFFCLEATTKNSIEPLTVAPEDAEATSRILESSVKTWLDEEWIEQDCHGVIAARAAAIYKSAVVDRGQRELGDVLVSLGTELSSSSSDFVEAFVGPWDVANYCSDVIAASINGEAGGCNAQDETLLAAAARRRVAVVAVRSSSPDNDESSLLFKREAAELRREAAAMEAELRRELPPKKRPVVVTELPGSTWTFDCEIREDDDSLSRRRVSFTATLLAPPPLRDLQRVDVNLATQTTAGGLRFESADATVRRGLSWSTQDDVDFVFFRASVDLEPGLLASTDGNTLYLNARVETNDDGVALRDCTLTVKRQKSNRVLFLQLPSIFAQYTVVGSFSATPSPTS